MSPEELEHARCLMESHEALKKQTGRALLAHIDMQTGQIETLTAALKNERADVLRYMSALSTFPKIVAYLGNTSSDRFLDESVDQLARELPAIFGKDEI